MLEDVLDGEDPLMAPFVGRITVTHGDAWSYGVELLAHRTSGRFSGWIGYTLSWTQMQFDELNFGEKFFARYDRRHDVSVVGVYELSDQITLSASWIYGTAMRFHFHWRPMRGQFIVCCLQIIECFMG